jgi:hypothetical protein
VEDVVRTPARAADAAYERLREICLAFPATEEKLSHGAPSFHVRGKMFVTFIDNHHGDGRLAAWVKSTLAEQRSLVAVSPERFFVPPYVGVGGWVGVRLDSEEVDWVELSMLVEAGWSAVAPLRIARGEVTAPPRARLPPSPRVTTDEKVASGALARLKAICLTFPEAELEPDGRHATFRVRKKVFAYFLDNHHGDGIISVCVKSDKAENAALIRKDPKHYYSPAYIGPRGYLGVRLDVARPDWKGVAARLTEGYRSVAPKGRGRSGASSTKKPKASGT